ncbi:hypothetical protein [Streptomyces sp. NPDC127033]|uniref:hypothetical protein n=1 Tax=Streptomyces sp. NPDC127033 TaxID=3347110 RepID=UPI0036659605
MKSAPADTGLRRALRVGIAPQLHLMAPVRHAVVAALRLWSVPKIADDMGLIATELVVNAIRHGDPGGVTVIPDNRSAVRMLRPGPLSSPKSRPGASGFTLAHRARRKPRAGLHRASSRPPSARAEKENLNE